RFVPSQDPIFCGHHLHTLPFIEMSEQTHHPGRLPPWDTDCHGHRRKLGPPPAGFGVPSFPDPSAVPLGPTTAVSSAGSDLSPLTAPLLLLLGTVPGLPGNGPATDRSQSRSTRVLPLSGPGLPLLPIPGTSLADRFLSRDTREFRRRFRERHWFRRRWNSLSERRYRSGCLQSPRSAAVSTRMRD